MKQKMGGSFEMPLEKLTDDTPYNNKDQDVN